MASVSQAEAARRSRARAGFQRLRERVPGRAQRRGADSRDPDTPSASSVSVEGGGCGDQAGPGSNSVSGVGESSAVITPTPETPSTMQ